VDRPKSLARMVIGPAEVSRLRAVDGGGPVPQTLPAPNTSLAGEALPTPLCCGTNPATAQHRDSIGGAATASASISTR
jgi:hypothetical protein